MVRLVPDTLRRRYEAAIEVCRHAEEGLELAELELQAAEGRVQAWQNLVIAAEETAWYWANRRGDENVV